MRAARRVLKAKAFDVVAHRPHRSCSGSAGQSTADHDHFVLWTVLGSDQFHIVFVVRPSVLNRAAGNLGVQFHINNRLSLLTRVIQNFSVIWLAVSG